VTKYTTCRRAGLEEKLKQQQYSEDEMRRIIVESEQRERDYTRLQRQRLSIADFEALTIIGRGAFGEVRPPPGSLVCKTGVVRPQDHMPGLQQDTATVNMKRSYLQGCCSVGSLSIRFYCNVPQVRPVLLL